MNTKYQPHLVSANSNQNDNITSLSLRDKSQQAKQQQSKREEINMDELQKRFQQAKEERKKVQREEKTIKQRVNILHSQEKMLMSKVETTKKSMTNLRDTRLFLEEHDKIRLSSAKRKEQELKELKEQVKERKNILREGLQQSKTLKDIKSMNTSITNKEEQKQNKKIQILNKLEDILKNATLHQSVKAMENLIEEKRKREVLEKKIKLKEELMMKLEREEITKKNLDIALINLEKEELEICNNFNSNEAIDELKGKKKINVSRK